MTAPVKDFSSANSSLVSIWAYRRMNGFELVFAEAQLNRRISIFTTQKTIWYYEEKSSNHSANIIALYARDTLWYFNLNVGINVQFVFLFDHVQFVFFYWIGIEAINFVSINETTIFPFFQRRKPSIEIKYAQRREKSTQKLRKNPSINHAGDNCLSCIVNKCVSFVSYISHLNVEYAHISAAHKAKKQIYEYLEEINASILILASACIHGLILYQIT